MSYRIEVVHVAKPNPKLAVTVPSWPHKTNAKVSETLYITGCTFTNTYITRCTFTNT